MNLSVRKLALLLGPAAALLLAACGPSPRSRASATLDDVESYINVRPDSALAVLQKIDTTMLHSSRLRAHYYLLRCIALDKTYVDDGSFRKEMEWAADWFSTHGRPDSRTKAYFYLADQQKDAGEYAEASVNFTRAQEMAEAQENWFLSGMASRNLSDIYFHGYDFSQSLEYARKSVTAFKKNGSNAHVLYARMQLATAYFNNSLLKECIDLCDSLRAEATEANNPGVLADVLSTMATAFIERTPPQYDSTLCLLDRFSVLFPLTAQKHAIYAWALCLKGDYESAIQEIHVAYGAANNIEDSLRVHIQAARIAEKIGDIEQYAILQREIVTASNALVRNSILHSVDRLQVHYLWEQEYKLKQIMQHNQFVVAVIILIVCLLLGFLLVLARMRKTRLKEKIRANEELSSKLSLYGTTVEETLDFGFDVLNKLSDAYYHPNTAREDVFRRIMKDYISEVAARERLGDAIEQNINIIHDDVITKLRKEIPSLKEKDIKLFSLYLFGFSYKAISEFFPEFSSVNSTYSRMSRLRKAIAESKSDHAGFFLSFFDNRPTYSGTNVQKN